MSESRMTKPANGKTQSRNSTISLSGASRQKTQQNICHVAIESSLSDISKTRLTKTKRVKRLPVPASLQRTSVPAYSGTVLRLSRPSGTEKAHDRSHEVFRDEAC